MINLRNKDSVAAKVEEILQQEALKGQQHQIDKNKNKKIDAQDFAILRGEKKAEVKEALVGDQHKIDKNKNKKIDAQDFKILRGEKKVEEGNNPFDYKNYTSQIPKKPGETAGFDSKKISTGTVYSRKPSDEKETEKPKGVKPKMEEVEQIDELSKSTLGSYIKKAATSSTITRKIGSDFEHMANKSRKPSSKAAATTLADKYKSMSRARRANIGKAVDRLTKEEVEQMDERKMTSGETVERERIVKGMKKSFSGFKARYGDKAKSVMYATATKQAMKEESEEPKKKSN